MKAVNKVRPFISQILVENLSKFAILVLHFNSIRRFGSTDGIEPVPHNLDTVVVVLVLNKMVIRRTACPDHYFMSPPLELLRDMVSKYLGARDKIRQKLMNCENYFHAFIGKT